MTKHKTILGTIVAVIVLVSAAFAMSDRFIVKATFNEFKEHIIYRLDTIDKKLDLILHKDE